MKKFLGILTATVFAFGWEINTHRAIDRSAIEKSSNLKAFVNGVFEDSISYKKGGA